MGVNKMWNNVHPIAVITTGKRASEESLHTCPVNPLALQERSAVEI